MIDKHIGQAAFRIGFYVALVAGILVLLTERDTPEHVVSLLTLIISFIFLITIVILVRFGSHG